jgi:hypothetical protein
LALAVIVPSAPEVQQILAAKAPTFEQNFVRPSGYLFSLTSRLGT